MNCLNFDLTPVSSAVLTATAVASATLSGTPAEQAAPALTPVQQATLTLDGVCTVSSDTIVVLAASDGPLRTRDGGYFLLDPATNPPGA